MPGFRACVGAGEARANCASPLLPAGVGPRRRTETAAKTPPDPRALRAEGLLELLRPSSDGKSASRAVAALQTAVLLSDQPAAILADLAAAHLQRAATTGSARDLFEALEVAEQALELDSLNAVAQFNEALALEQLGLSGEAARSWRRYVDLDDSSGWRDEARRHLARIVDISPQPAAPAPDAPVPELAAWAGRHTEEAISLGFDRLLGEWGSRTLAGVPAENALQRAEAVGREVAAGSKDATLADAVAVIRAAGTRAAVRRMARAHVEYASGRAAFQKRDYAGAVAHLRRSAAAANPFVLRQWSTVYLASAQLYSDPAAAERILRGVDADATRYPALVGQARWAVGMALQRQGRHQSALAAFREAAGHFQRAGEPERVGAMLLLQGEAELRLGDGDAAYTSFQRALITFRPEGGSVWLHNLLYLTATAVAGDGLYRAAMRVQDEGVAVAEQTEPAYAAEARLARARLRVAAGRGGTQDDIQRARRVIEGLGAGYSREWLETDLMQTEAMAELRSRPTDAAVKLDRVVGFFSRPRNPSRLIPALLARADARLGAGSTAQAEADLRRAMGIVAEQRDSLSSAELRAYLLNASQRVFERATMVSLDAGQPAAALAHLERNRISFAPTGASPTRAELPPRSRLGEVALDLALIGDTVLAWTVTGTDVRLVRTTLARRRLLHVVKQASLARDPDALATLYEWLIRPSAARLGPPGSTLAVVADGEFASIPFPALRDRARGRYLVEDHPLRFAATLGDPVPTTRAPVAGTPVLLIADPAFDARGFPELSRLGGAAREVRALREMYPGARVVAGADAGAGTLLPLFAGSSIIHYAGHAVFDDERPEQSYLVLASAAGGGPARLTAASIETLKLSGVRLVVLSACQTAPGQGGRSGGFAGLAGAFMAAGAQGVVGSLWPLDDGSTAPLMSAFHRAFRATGDAPGALRAAQLEMLRSHDAGLRDPATWAGVRYMGG